MHRSISKVIKESFRQAKYLPVMIREFDNWFTFLLSYLRLLKSNDKFLLRNGMIIYVDRSNDDGWSPSVLMDVLVKKDYGLIADNSVVIDIGANIGIFSLYAAYKNNCICYSFEPEETNFGILEKNIEANNLEGRIIPFRNAVSNVNGTMKLYSTISMSHSLNIVTDRFYMVDTVTIEKIMRDNKLEKIDYLKVDCEGGEYDIFYNCDEKVFRSIDNILIEYHNFGNGEFQNGDSLIAFLKEKGFVLKLHNRISNKLGIVHFANGK